MSEGLVRFAGLSALGGIAITCLSLLVICVAIATYEWKSAPFTFLACGFAGLSVVLIGMCGVLGMAFFQVARAG